jgi:hypothetical protein
VRYNARHGAMLVQATDTSINFRFIADTGVVIDSYWIHKAATAATRTSTAVRSPWWMRMRATRSSDLWRGTGY